MNNMIQLIALSLIALLSLSGYAYFAIFDRRERLRAVRKKPPPLRARIIAVARSPQELAEKIEAFKKGIEELEGAGRAVDVLLNDLNIPVENGKRND